MVNNQMMGQYRAPMMNPMAVQQHPATVNQNGSMMNQYNSFIQNPLAFLLQRKINIPQEYANNPEGAIQYLMNTGQMSQETFEQLKVEAYKMGFNL